MQYYCYSTLKKSMLLCLCMKKITYIYTHNLYKYL